MLCINCGTELHLQVLESTAGYYIGTMCPECGPHSRDSNYYETKEDAAILLKQVIAHEENMARLQDEITGGKW